MTLSRYLLLVPLFLVLVIACSDEPDDSGDEAAITPVVGAPDEASGTPGPPVPGAILTPQPGLRTDLATAKRLESEGDIERAASGYIAVAAAKGADSSEATLSAARLLLELERPEDARLLLEPFLSRAALTGNDPAGRYLLARAYAALERWEDSLQQYDLYIESGRPAVAYAYLDRHVPLLQLQRPFEAAASVQSGFGLDVAPSMQPSYLLATAQSYERAGNFSEALTWYNRLLNQSILGGDQAFALARIADLKELRDDPTHREDRRRLMRDFPGSSHASEMLEEAKASGETVEPNVEGLILYRHNEYTRAEPAFQRQVDAAPDEADSAAAYYYLGAIQETRGDLEAAQGSYAKVDELDPGNPLADDALWWRARILEHEDDLAGAAPLYARLVAEYPNSTFAPDAAFRRGMLGYRRGEYESAAATWQADLGIVTEPEERLRLTLWQAKALKKANHDDQARPILEPMTRQLQDDYHGIRALALLDGKHDHPKAGGDSRADLTPDFDWPKAEEWLLTKTGAAVLEEVWQADPRWWRGQELWRIGRVGHGDAEIFNLMAAHSDNAVAMYTLSRRLLAEGRVSMSARAGQRLMRVLDANPNEGLPKALLSLSYPAAFGPLVEKYAKDQGVSPLLLLAFIRQESFFDPRAVSPVGALGLTQVLPETGQSVAEKLDVQNFSEAGLLHADLNLRLGARYMADQLDRFDDEVFVALAAYNAGPGAAQRWRDAAGKDADLFLETIEFHESRLYVEIVSENYAIYRYLYGDAKEPNLPN